MKRFKDKFSDDYWLHQAMDVGNTNISMAGPPMSLPGGALEICFSFDTTLSMTSYVDQVKARLQDMVQKLKSDISGIRIALFAHGDYYQENHKNKNPYVTRHIDFTDDIPELCKFIEDSVPTTGGDWAECYELVMKEAREQLTWTPGTNRVLVMIGDARPHSLDDYGRKFTAEKIDWKDETEKLLNTNIRCYGVYCNTDWSGDEDKQFFQTLSESGKGSFLELKNFDSIFDFMMAICYREHGEDALTAYEAEVRGRTGGTAKDVHNMLTTLKKSVSNASTEGAATRSSKTKAQKQTNTTATKTKSSVVKPKAKAQPSKGKTSIKSKPPAAKVLALAEGTAPKTRSMNKVGRKRLNLYKVKTTVLKQRKLRRERVPETNFALKDFPWSSWKVVMSSECRKNLLKVTQSDKVVEYLASDIFKRKTKCPALYEFAVKPRGCRQKKVVYSKISPGFSSYSSIWWKVLFPLKSLREQINNIIRKQGGDIFVRRLILKKYQRYSSVPSVVRNYDYVWVPEDSAKKYRELKKDDYLISEEMEVE